MIRLFLMFISILFILKQGDAQNPQPDSLLRVYEQQPADTNKLKTINHLINATMYSSPGQSEKYAREQLQLAKDLKLKKWQSLANFHLGVLKNNQDNYTEARMLFDLSYQLASDVSDSLRMVLAINGRAVMEMNLGNYLVADSLNEINIQILERRNDQYRLSNAYGIKSRINQSTGNYNIAYQFALQAVNILEDFDKPVRLADALIHLADVEYAIENPDMAIRHNERALAIYRDFNDIMYQAQVLSNLGGLFLDTGNKEQAIRYLNEAIEMADSAESISIRANAMNYLGNLYLQTGQENESLKQLNEALQLYDQINDKHGKVQSLLLIGENLISSQEYIDADYQLSEAIEIAEDKTLLPERATAYQLRANAMEESGNLTQAIDDLKKYKILSDSIFAAEKLEQIEELRIIYETEKKDQEIELQRFQLQLMEEKQRNSRISIALLIILLFFIVVTTFLTIKYLRNKLQRKKMEYETSQKLLAMKKREMTTQVLQIAQKNEMIAELKDNIEKWKSKSPDPAFYRQIMGKINMDSVNENSWVRFRIYFDEMYQGFEERVREIAPDITAGEFRLMALMKLNLTSQEIASVLNISGDGIKKARYRLRKKIQLEQGESLEEFIANIDKNENQVLQT